MMMDTTVDTDGTAFICPECSFNGKSLPELISHLNEAHSEETANKSEAPPKNVSSIVQPEKRSRRKPAFSHQIVSQAPRSSSTLFNQQSLSNVESDSNELWNRISTSDKNGTTFLSTMTDDSSLSIISDENTNINMASKTFSNSLPSSKRNPNVLHSILSQQRPIAPKNGSPMATKTTPTSTPSLLPMINSSPGTDNSFYSPTNPSMQSFKKNFQCQMCRLTYKNFHDCTAHIRKKHEISHAQAGRYVEKLDSDVRLPPSATGNYKFRVKVKSLPPAIPSQQQQLVNSQSTSKRTSLLPTMNENVIKIFQCKYCSFTSNWSKDITKHQRENHPNYPPHILKKEYLNHHDNEINNNNNNNELVDDEPYSALLIDPVRAFGEVIDTMENTDENEYENNESQDEEMIVDYDVDDDEEDALWKYQQEINSLSENNNFSLTKPFKNFRCPHCEHSASTLAKLKLHVSTHSNIKPFMCSICGWRANLRWYIQCHATKRHPNMNYEVLQLSPEEAEQTIHNYMKERSIDQLDANSHCQYRLNDRTFPEQHLSKNVSNKYSTKMLMNKKSSQLNGHSIKSNGHDDNIYSKFVIKSSTCADEQNTSDIKSQALYNRSSLIQADGTMLLPDPSKVVYKNFSLHPNFNPNRLFYCALCYRGYRWRYDVKRHHKTMHETPEDEAAMGLSMSPKSIKRRNKEFNRNFRYLEYVPQLDGLISASMSSVNNHVLSRHDNNYDNEQQRLFMENLNDNECDESQDNDLNLSIADARTVDVTEDEAAALLMIEPQKSDQSSIVINDHPNNEIIVFEDDRTTNLNDTKERSLSITTPPPLSQNEISKLTPPSASTATRASSGFKPYRCPYCFYRTNWRTDSLRHIRARHKIEPTQDGYYEMTLEEAENTYAEYERTFGFVVSKKVLGRFTDFRHMEWKDLQKSIWEKIKDKQGYEQIIYDRLRPDDNSDYSSTDISKPIPLTPSKPNETNINNNNSRTTLVKPKRMFTCMECAFRSHKLVELDKHICKKYKKSQQEKPHGKSLVSLYQCTKCSYKTIYRNYARKHIYLHRSKTKIFYYCSFCGYNHQQRYRIALHIAKQHPLKNTVTTISQCQYECDADFSLKQINLRRSFIERQLNDDKSRVFYCIDCPHISTSILEHDHHRSCHQANPKNIYKCTHCSFASNSLLYTRQHTLLHSKASRLLSLYVDTKNIKHLPVSMIYKETLGKNRRYHCPFCKKFSSSTSSIVLDHIKNTHTGNSSQFDDSLIIGSDMAKGILALGETVTDDQQQMDIS